MNDETFEVAGFRVRRTDGGGASQTDILGIHGWGGGIQTFDPLLPFVPPGVTLWSIDLPGYGGSLPLDEWRYEVFNERASLFIRAFEPETFRLFGNCSGAIFGMLLSQQEPSRVTALDLIDPFAFFPWYFRVLTEKTFGEFFYRSAFSNPIGRYLTQRSVAKGRGNPRI